MDGLITDPDTHRKTDAALLAVPHDLYRRLTARAQAHNLAVEDLACAFLILALDTGEGYQQTHTAASPHRDDCSCALFLGT